MTTCLIGFDQAVAIRPEDAMVAPALRNILIWFVRELDDLIAERGRPKMIVSDNGTELTSNAVLAWSGNVGVEWHYTAQGKPTQNGFNER